jgi:hypothetical protein
MTTGTRRNFQDMLNEYLPNELLKEELIMRDYIIQNVQKDNNWKGGKLIVPFKGSGATSVSFNQLTPASDIIQSKYVRGSIDDYREVWGSLIFNQRDLQEHDGKIPESTFLRLLPDELEDFMDYKKEVVSIQFGTGPNFATVTVNGTAGGVIGVDKIDRFQVNQKFVLRGDTAPDLEVYVTNVNNTGVDIDDETVTVSATPGGAPINVSAYTIADNAKMYHPGVSDGAGNFNTFISFKDAFLSAANGGAASLHGVPKKAWPILQAVNIDGSGITATNILDGLFDAYTEVRRRSKGRATEYLMSLKNYGSIMKQLELQKGAFRVVEDPKESLFGWMEMKIANVTGQVLKFVGIQEWDDDTIALVDWRSITFRSNGYFKKRISPDGREYFEVRNTNGYQYIVDCCLFGEMEYKKPGHSAIIHSISY